MKPTYAISLRGCTDIPMLIVTSMLVPPTRWGFERQGGHRAVLPQKVIKPWRLTLIQEGGADALLA